MCVGVCETEREWDKVSKRETEGGREIEYTENIYLTIHSYLFVNTVINFPLLRTEHIK